MVLSQREMRVPTPFHFCLVVILLGLVACGTGGSLITEDQLSQIKQGTSTQEDVRKVLGSPVSVKKPQESENGNETWVYPISKYASDPYTGVPPIGVVGAPVTRARRKTTEVEIGFDEKGVVRSIEERRPPQ